MSFDVASLEKSKSRATIPIHVHSSKRTFKMDVLASDKASFSLYKFRVQGSSIGSRL